MITGPVYPIILPFTANKQIDVEALESYIMYIIQEGGENVMVASATSRFAQLSFEEIMAVNRITVKTVSAAGGTPIASTPISGNTQSHVEVAQQAQKDGAKIVICEYPWRYQGTEPLLDYFQEIICNTDVDIMLHVTPTRSEIETTFGKTHRYEIDDLEQICALPRVIGFKEASGDKEHSCEIWKALGQSTNIIVAVAASETFLEARVHGATGFFTGIESIFPRLGQEVYNRILDNDIDQAASMVTQMSDLLHACKKLGWHAASKYCLFNLGIMGLDERPPMTPISEHQQKMLQPKIAKLRFICEQYD